MNPDLNDMAIKLAEEDITVEEGKRRLLAAGKALIPSIGFEAAVDAAVAAESLFEDRHLAACCRRMRERNRIKGFRFIPKLG